jgi:hypothetical protein
MTRVEAARENIDQAARLLAQADVQLGDPTFDGVAVERTLLESLKLVLNALALLRGAVG